MASMPASTIATVRAPTLAEATNNYLSAIGIRAKLRPLERVSFDQQYRDKKLKNIIQGRQWFIRQRRNPVRDVRGEGRRVCLRQLSDLDAMFDQQAVELDHGKRTAMLNKDAADPL